jgi:pyruvate dehydrogenase E1 component
MVDMSCQVIDNDVNDFELNEWLDSLTYVINHFGSDRAGFIVQQLVLLLSKHADDFSVCNTPVCNTIDVSRQQSLPDNKIILKKSSNFIKWNALATVVNAAKSNEDLGGHISTYASSCILYDIGWNYFFRGRSQNHLEDMIFTQGHAAPGIYARALLEKRLTETQLLNFRKECSQTGVSSYPHPWLMPDFWQFPTVSMGLGALSAVYHARFLKYLINRKFIADSSRKVWAFCGDGEVDEPETLSALSFASYEGLDNLIFVINCNLQRLDGLVRSSGSIVKELEAKFKASGWRVIKVLFNSYWDPLFAKDKHGVISKAFAACIDGQMQRFSHGGGKVLREEFFNQSAELKSLIHGMSDDDLDKLSWGGHDFQKVYAAYYAAVEKQKVPTVILVQTTKGHGVPKTAGINAAHNVKKLDADSLIKYAKQNELPLSEEDAKNCKFLLADDNQEVANYLSNKRASLGGFLPKRYSDCAKLPVPDLDYFASIYTGTDRAVSSTMAFVRILSMLLKFEGLSQHVVPIVADESRTFGMEGLFRQIGIYNRHGQNYQPVDKNQLMYYKESKSGSLISLFQSFASTYSPTSFVGSTAAFPIVTTSFFILTFNLKNGMVAQKDSL